MCQAGAHRPLCVPPLQEDVTILPSVPQILWKTQRANSRQKLRFMLPKQYVKKHCNTI